MRTHVAESFQYRTAMEKIKQECESTATVISNKLNTRTRQILAQYKHDAEFSQQLDQAATIFTKVFTGALKAIPGFGGFFSIICDIANDPVKGAYSALRTEYAGNWDFMSNPNSVMSPLTTNEKKGGTAGYALQGRIGRFNNDPKLRFEQFESDMTDLLGKNVIFPDGKKASGPSHTQVGFKGHSVSSVKENGYRFSKMWATLRLGTLKNLAQTHEDDWTWHSISLLVRSMYRDSDGRKDIANGVFYAEDAQGQSYLMRGKREIESVKPEHGRLTTDNSNLSRYLTRMKDTNFYEEMNKRVGNELINSACRNRVETTKALFMAYEHEVRDKLESSLSTHFRTLMNWSRNPRVTKEKALSMAKSQEIEAGICKGLFVLLTGGTALLLPKGIYDINTSVDTDECAHIMIAVDLFYQILTAYMDEAFVCDKLPTDANVRLFAVAFSDAYTSAVQYVGNLATRRNERKEFMKLLTTFIKNDPTIFAFMQAIVAKEIDRGYTADYFSALGLNEYVSTPPGLSQFCNSMVFGIYDASKNYDECTRDYQLRKIVVSIDSVLNELRSRNEDKFQVAGGYQAPAQQQANDHRGDYQYDVLKPFETDMQGYRSSGKRFDDFYEDSAVAGFGHTLHEYLVEYNQSSIELIEDESVSEKLSQHIYKTNKILAALVSLVGNNVLTGDLKVQDPSKIMALKGRDAGDDMNTLGVDFRRNVLGDDVVEKRFSKSREQEVRQKISTEELKARNELQQSFQQQMPRSLLSEREAMGRNALANQQAEQYANMLNTFRNDAVFQQAAPARQPTAAPRVGTQQRFSLRKRETKLQGRSGWLRTTG